MGNRRQEINNFCNKKIAKKKSLKLLEIKNELKNQTFLSNSSSNFKIKNLAMAVKAAKLCGIKEKSINKSLKKLKDVNGRLELVRKYRNNVKFL